MTARPYRIITVSVYEDELPLIDEKVAALRELGLNASRSSVLRQAAMALDVTVLQQVHFEYLAGHNAAKAAALARIPVIAPATIERPEP